MRTDRTLRWLRTTRSGRLAIDRAKAKAEERLDGKYLLTSSDPHLTLTAEETAVGYKALLEAERGFRDLKTVLELRPVFHRLEHRIRAHVLLCWLALLLIRVAERRTGHTWNRISTELGRVHEVTLTGTAGQLIQTTPLTGEQATLYRDCGIKPPPPGSPPQTPPDQLRHSRVGTHPHGRILPVSAAQTPYRTPLHAYQLRKSGLRGAGMVLVNLLRQDRNPGIRDSTKLRAAQCCHRATMTPTHETTTPITPQASVNGPTKDGC